MEMYYDGALVMPKNYAVVDEEEMTYVEGGDAKNFSENLKGLWAQSEQIRYALKLGRIDWGYICNCAYYSYTSVVSYCAATLGVSTFAINAALGVLAAVSAVAVVAYIWDNRIWY